MIDDWSLIKNALLIAYIAESNHVDLTRRKLGTLIYVLSEISEKKSISSISVYPDGFDIPEVNVVLDVLRSLHLINIQKRAIRITKRGIMKVEELLSNPDDHRVRINYRLISYLIKHDYNTLMTLAIYLANKKSEKTIISEELLNIIKNINDMINRFNLKGERKVGRKLINK